MIYFINLNCLFCRLPQIIFGAKQVDGRMKTETENEVVEAERKVEKREKEMERVGGDVGGYILKCSRPRYFLLHLGKSP